MRRRRTRHQTSDENCCNHINGIRALNPHLDLAKLMLSNYDATLDHDKGDVTTSRPGGFTDSFGDFYELF
eukprot:g21614.t1